MNVTPRMQASGKLRVALLMDDRCLNKWQEEALSAISDLVDVVVVLNCRNTVTSKTLLKHCAYYALNLVSMKSALTKKQRPDFESCPTIDFNSIYVGAWQSIPDEVVSCVIEADAAVILKFGMSLLKMDNLEPLDVLSFHHGDPRYYRGRPAGFYELLHGVKTVGVMVQKLSNVLDGGEVIALGHFKAFEYSYSETIQGMYRNSPPILRRAVMNYIAGVRVTIDPSGKNYRLPSNLLVLRFCARLVAKKAKRLIYGAFFEKRWNVAVFKKFDLASVDGLFVANAKSATVPERFSFYADPFFSADGSVIRAEALVGTTGRV